jgi:predicted RNA binding protein YcfA (HicA-like mRNA interferase family)
MVVDRSSVVSGQWAVLVKFRDLIRMLEADGWWLARTTGSHRQFKHPVKLGTVTVAGKANHDVPPGTLNSILKQAGLKERGNP